LSLLLSGPLSLLVVPATAQDDDPGPGLPAVTVVTNVVAEPDPYLLRNFLLLQEQLRSTQQAVEQAREEAQAQSKQAAELLAARLNLIEQTMQNQRQQEVESMQRLTRAMLTVVGLVTGLGFFAVVFAGIIQVRAMTRLTDISRHLQLALPPPRVAEIGPGSLPANQEGVELANRNLLGAIARLEKRLEEVEASATTGTQTATNGHKQIPAPASSNPSVVTILGKGQALLNLNKAEEALEHFEEALSIDPKNVEAWIKKGTALERLQRVDDAILAYDQAIATDNSTATAYLFKAGVYNRQKKYAEALQCYEKALSVQQRSRSAQVSKA
jgi:tetratricopeptide (TPR) repeat protein